jgi:CMP-N-acetylneuraminic acid synthetase|tara:strand:- start:3745 stop:4530 length:786 start_codon:yes stop_codon:yes gene_type:complete
MSRVVFVTIARGGSVRLPRKNVLPFCGLPLIAWAIIQARCSHLITDVYLSTDDDEIADIGEEHGASIIRRSHELAALAAGPSFIHALDTIKHPIDILITHLPTSPVRPPEEFDNVIKLYMMLREQGANQVGPLLPRSEMIVYKQIGPHRVEKCLWKKDGRYFLCAGSWSICAPDWYRKIASLAPTGTDEEVNQQYNSGERHDPNDPMYYYPLKAWQAVDIDYQEQFELAQVLMEHYVLKGEGQTVYERYRARHQPNLADEG